MTNKPIFTGLSPNAEREDVLLSARLLFSRGKWLRGEAIGDLEAAFQDYLPARSAVSFLSGRTALWAILKALGVGKGDEVLLQAYTCVVVANAIIALGARPVWVDIHPATFNIDEEDLKKKITPQAKAVIVQHTFGQAAAIEKISRIARKRRLAVVEDVAQALGGEWQGKKLGTFGQAALFSFGRDKIISSVFGGMATTNEKKIGKRLKKIQARLPFPAKTWLVKQLFHPLAYWLIIPTYSFFGLGQTLHFFLSKAGWLSRAVAPLEKKGEMPPVILAQMPNALAALALKQFERLEKFNQKRIKMAQFYAKELKGLKIQLPKVKKDGRHVFLRYPIKTKKAAALINFARKENIFLGDWYCPAIAPQGVSLGKVFYQPHSCPKAEKVAERSVNLPTHPKMTLEKAQRVAAVVKKFFKLNP